MTGRFSGKVALITGGLSGIGAATVAAFLREGASVAAADIARPGASQAPAGDRLRYLTGDVCSGMDAERLVAETHAVFGRLDILVNSAGIGSLAASDEESFDHWRKTLAVNLDGTFLMSRAAIRSMLRSGGGAIVNIASIHGHVGFPCHAAYTASKGGVVNLTRSLAIEYAARGIRVNAVCPGFVRTPMIDAGLTDEMLPKVVAMHPIGRIARPEEIAGPVLFLASEDASFIVGANLLVDGGYTAQ